MARIEQERSAEPRVCVEAKTGRLGRKAFELLRRHVRERSGLEVAEGGAPDLVLDVDPGLRPQSFRITGSEGDPARVSGGDGLGLIHGLGKWLRTSSFAPGRIAPSSWRGLSEPANPVRGIYFATHFHNWYHLAPPEEVARYVEELALCGCNCLSVWFDLHHYPAIDDPAAQAMIARLRGILGTANAVGMGASLTLLANEGFATTPEALRATNAVQNGYLRAPGGFYHTEICPAQPGGMDLVLRNRKAVFEAFKGIDLDYVWIWPYDQGGCTCADCAPWGANGFLRTARPVAELARTHFPKAKVILATWYFDRFVEGEWAGFHRWVEEMRPAWFDMLLVDGFGAFPDYPLRHGIPGGLPVVGFPEISMEGNSPWGGYGANPRPRHWADYWQRSKRLQAGNFPYSEGIYEDINKFLMLQLNWSPDRDVDEILGEYVEGWFGTEFASELVACFRMMERDEGTSLGGSPPTFRNGGGLPDAEACEKLVAGVERRLPAAVRDSWRWRVIRLRAFADAELKRSGLRFGERLDGIFAELSRIYCADPQKTLGCVRPPHRR